MLTQLKIIQLVIWIQLFKCWSRYVMFDFDLSSEIVGSSQEVCSFASWLNSRPACCKPTGRPSWLPLVPSFASALGQEKRDFAAGGEAIKICQNYSGASSFRLFGSQLVYMDLVNCEEVLVIDVTKITRPEARSVMTPSCGSMFPTCFWCGSNLPRASCAMLTPVLSTKRSYIDITIISPRV